MVELVRRMRRNRKSEALRDLVQETHLIANDLVQPIFVVGGKGVIEPISSMPGINRLSLDLLELEVRELYSRGIKSVALFPVLGGELKDDRGSDALNPSSLVYQALNHIKSVMPEMMLIMDVALDPYTSHGHDGVIDDRGHVMNDETIDVLCEMAYLGALSGADIVAPSDMMDGRVGAIRQTLDAKGMSSTSILAYAAKYASSLYGPFREAAKSAPKFGDKKSYQMNPANVREAILECRLDEEEGADILMVKPALSYLDVISKVRENTQLPIAAYHVSGEYSMVMAAHQKGWIDGPKVMHEHLLSIKRAGADIIFSYASKDIAQQLGV